MSPEEKAWWALWKTVLWFSKERWARALRVHGSGGVHRRLSRLHSLPRTAGLVDFLILAMERHAAMPDMVGGLAASS